MIQFNSIKFSIIYVLKQQPQGQFQTAQQRNDIRKMHKYKQQTRTHRKGEIKITPNNNRINNITIVKEKFAKS
jgi:hypothetical protein